MKCVDKPKKENVMVVLQGLMLGQHPILTKTGTVYKKGLLKIPLTLIKTFY